MSQQLDTLHQSISTLQQSFSQDTSQMSVKRTIYLGPNGKFKELTNVLKDLPVEDKKQAGQALNELKAWLNEQMGTDTTTNTNTVTEDSTLPGIEFNRGHVHPVSQAIKEVTQIFERIGFTRVRYPEIDWDWYAFESLNMAPNHPARDEWETFFIDLPDSTKDIPYDPLQPRSRHPDIAGGKVVLTPHTSNGQVREMERLKNPPIRMINIARCYRRQSDVTHTPMFHQFEGLVVDKGINIQHLKGTIDHFAHAFYGSTAKSRIRPFHFQFTEPSFEVDFSCTICDGTGTLSSGEKCRFCKSGWHEVGGAGMVHPNVLRAGGLDPEIYTGFAFGWGIERTYTLRPGLHIDDIRMLYNGDLQLLEQF
ncbi:phenylalanine--tRNA ligase subunit alpha [Candidatus Woesebacteria bacterium]|nr:phenylalanine--tRNA ligase subunit alpha [Candidatus Woesebacteria bacterium]